MQKVKAYAAFSEDEDLKPHTIERRDLNENDVLVDILYCGVCHSDIHKAKNEWDKTNYPLVPGHEIIGKVLAIGSKVTRHKVGDTVGVGVIVDSCMQCSSCRDHLEQYCEKGAVSTYNAIGYDGQMTYGGYSDKIVTREEFVLSIPDGLDLKGAAPLLCAGITTYSPINYHNVKEGDYAAVVGLGGLGHMAVKILKAKGAHVSVFTTSEHKVEDAHRLGANRVILSKDEEQMKKAHGNFDFIINTVSVSHNISDYVQCLKRDGVLVMEGIPQNPHSGFDVKELIFNRKSINGSIIGGMKETQEMLDFCAKHQITSDVEMISIQQINEAFERTLKSDVKYRFVIDMKSLKES